MIRRAVAAPQATAAAAARFMRMSGLPRLVLLHAGGGFVIAAVFVAAILLTDPGGLGSLLLAAPEGPWPALLLWLFSGLTFATALGVTALAPPPERPRGVLVPPEQRRGALVPLPVRARRPRR